ncbi:modifier of mdg4 isoform X3 [Musca domestica]|uniref:Modifier of mdg4 isoform X3 n=1 Tax=Musca domestica TaxID=7370 RepID=A0ABM3V6S2_MUSDO|nr:modifier of mdg4 isoform X3 [Musca domestica]
MADDEQFSLCWNNFNSNLSAGFHESLCRGDLVDVTLAAEGQFVKAHRLVLSVCSPYFRKMFTQMPANQHAFVFLKDVSHTALKDLIQFMYCGEVNVKQEALPAFISTAEALQIKGLTDSDPPQSQTPPEPSTPTPQIQPQQIQNPARVRQRTSTARSYKIETVDDSGDDTKQTTQIVIQTTAPTHPPQATITTQAPQQQHHHHHQQQQQPPQQQHIQQPMQTQTHQLTSVSLPTATTTTAVVSHKRPAQRTNLGSVPHIKRTKSTIDPLEATDASVATQQINVQGTLVTSDVTKSQAQQHHHQQQQQQTQSHHHHQQSQPQQQSNEPEYIDLPIELPTKSEPDYVEDAGDVDQGEQDGNYVEDESYGDMRYDESYFTEGEDGAATGGNASTGGTTNAGATATTSKAIVKSQPLSDSSYMDTTGDQGNSDAQEQRDIIIKGNAFECDGNELDDNASLLSVLAYGETNSKTLKQHKNLNTYSCFQNFEIPWQKVSPQILDALRNKQRNGKLLNTLCNIIVDDLRLRSSQIPMSVYRRIAHMLAIKFPDSFAEKDGDGRIVSYTPRSLATKMKNRNNFLNSNAKVKGKLSLKVANKKGKKVKSKKVECKR